MGYYFELPSYTDVGNGGLTTEQRTALDEDEAIALSGGPGTGKTVVSLWRHIRNYDLSKKNSLLLTYTKTLEYYLALTATSKNKVAGDAVARTYCWIKDCEDNRAPKKHYDEIIIDEAQDVEIGRYKVLKQYSDILSYGADEAQSLYYPKSSTMKELKDEFNNNEEYELSQNFRNSKEILLFIKSFFPNISISYDTLKNAPNKEIKPIVQKLSWSDFDTELIDNIIEISKDFDESTHNIGILLPTTNAVEKYYKLLSNKIECSMYHNKMDNFIGLDRIHITTFKSVKGLEFDTIILPNFDSYKWYIENMDIVEENDYYVALTRAKLNLFLLCKNDLDINSTDTYIKE